MHNYLTPAHMCHSLRSTAERTSLNCLAIHLRRKINKTKVYLRRSRGGRHLQRDLCRRDPGRRLVQHARCRSSSTTAATRLATRLDSSRVISALRVCKIEYDICRLMQHTCGAPLAVGAGVTTVSAAELIASWSSKQTSVKQRKRSSECIAQALHGIHGA